MAGMGAFLDFHSGTVKRAPLFMRKVRLEWFYRLIVEPKRLWKRYLLGNLSFILRVARDKNKT